MPSDPPAPSITVNVGGADVHGQRVDALERKLSAVERDDLLFARRLHRGFKLAKRGFWWLLAAVAAAIVGYFVRAFLTASL